MSYDFSGNDPNLTYAWNGIPGTDSYTTTQSGTLILEWGLLVCSASDEVELSHHPTYEVSWEEDPIVLCLDEVETAPALDPAGGGNVSWLWSDAQRKHPDRQRSGLYEVEITTPNCTFTYDLT